ncbi:periplasmic cobalamin-binding protein [Pseudomonas sp. Os17]|uniref:cobalamin-binding protein n=1 Tax=Pseudomonas TaxID=286 RepID=UPI0005FC59FE|nr:MULTISPECIES: cobalamin-binding protein [Pseudomonas]RXU61384.1 cobalamin-binding protein [Pseudomonas protegens]BAQ77154.1 periplasmic cobalamin-binding protein [Pseudomonas sp. Os17]
MWRWLAVLCLLVGTPALAAQRVVSLAPSLSEIVVELGASDLLVGVLDAGERPAPLKDLPSVGRYGQLDIERLLSLRPDLLLLWPGSVGPAQRDQLARLGIPTYVAEPHDFKQLTAQIAEIGERLGRSAAARKLAAELDGQLAGLRARYHREPALPVFYQVWDRPLYTVGGGQIISEALSVCGARNVFVDQSLPAPQVSIESVLQRNPQAILATAQGQLDAWKAWPQIAAVQQGRLLLVRDKGLERPSGQMIAATAKLCALIAPER